MAAAAYAISRRVMPAPGNSATRAAHDEISIMTAVTFRAQVRTQAKRKRRAEPQRLVEAWSPCSRALQAYFRKIPVAVATSFLARLLRFGSSQLVQKCVSRRGGHDWLGGANAHLTVPEIVSEFLKKSVFP